MNKIKFVTITKATLTNDLSIATIYYTVYGNQDQINASMEALNEAKGFIRKQCPWQRAAGSGNPGGLLPHVAHHSLRFHGNEVNFRVISGQSSSLQVFDLMQGPSWEKAMAPHSSTLAWEIRWTEEHGRLQSMA